MGRETSIRHCSDRALAMLPVVLSEGLVSLNPGVTRRAVIIDISVATDGSITRSHFLRARIRSRLQLTYAGVQRVVDGDAELDDARAPNPLSLAVATDESVAIIESLRQLKRAGLALESAQRRRGVTPFDRTESEIGVQGEPPMFDIEPRERLGSERWNEQLSLACNMQGAALLVALESDDPSLEPVFRVHDAPGSGRLQDLAAGRHHALAADSYARFSSPMREIVGIHTHLVALDALGLQSSEAARSAELRDAVIESAQNARARQKTLDRGILFEVIAELFETDLAR